MTKITSAKNLLGDIKSYIERVSLQTAQAVNAGLVTLYWRIGKRIKQEILKGKRAGYGEKIVHAVSAQLGWTHQTDLKFMAETVITI